MTTRDAQEQRSEQQAQEQAQQQDFVGYPRGQVLGIFDDASAAAAATADLRQAGFAEDQVTLFEGEADAAKLDSTGREHGVLASFTRAVSHLMSDVDHLAQYDRALRGGARVVAAYAPEDDRRERALEVFRTRGARFVNFYGAMTVETLER